MVKSQKGEGISATPLESGNDKCGAQSCCSLENMEVHQCVAQSIPDLKLSEVMIGSGVKSDPNKGTLKQEKEQPGHPLCHN